jgi:hypothetical protein
MLGLSEILSLLKILQIKHGEKLAKRREKLSKKKLKSKHFFLLRLVAECFSLYRTRILTPNLKTTYRDDNEINQLPPNGDPNNVSREELISIVEKTGIMEDEYDALNNLRYKRNRECHRKPLSKEGIACLGRQAWKFNIFQSGVANGSNYPVAIQKLSNVRR